MIENSRTKDKELAKEKTPNLTKDKEEVDFDVSCKTVLRFMFFQRKSTKREKVVFIQNNQIIEVPKKEKRTDISNLSNDQDETTE